MLRVALLVALAPLLVLLQHREEEEDAETLSLDLLLTYACLLLLKCVLTAVYVCTGLTIGVMSCTLLAAQC